METHKENEEVRVGKAGGDIKNEDPVDYSDPSVPKPLTHVVEGLRMPMFFSAECIRSAINYKPRPDDLILATYPKCGTTWTQHILLLIYRHGEPLKSNLQFFTSAPFLEVTGAEGAEKMPRPGPIKVHLPYNLTPRSGNTAKYIYITRNPKDCVVSYFHHMRDMPGHHSFTGTFDQFFEYFISGNIDYGDYFDHLLGWYEHRNDPNVLFMTYEEMKENPEKCIMKIASFIDDELYAAPLRDDPQKLQNVVKYSSFDHMKKEVNEGMEKLFSMSKEEMMKANLPEQMLKMVSNVPPPPEGKKKLKPVNFVRKGIIGDWRNYFSEDQSRRLNEKFAQRTKGTDIPSLWEKYM